MHKQSGVSVVIATYHRHKSLTQLLRGLLKQIFDGSMEVIIINNDRQPMTTNWWSRLGRTLAKVPELTIINLSRNLGCAVRYPLAQLAKYETILLLDDDVEIISADFVSTFLRSLQTKRKIDLVSGWCTKFLKRKIPDYYQVVNQTFLDPNLPETEVDLVGPGLCIFDKCLLTPKLITIPQKYQAADNVWLSMMTSLLFRSKKYYVPCHGLVRFHQDHRNAFAMYKQASVDRAKRQAVKELFQLGYVPLYARK